MMDTMMEILLVIVLLMKLVKLRLILAMLLDMGTARMLAIMMIEFEGSDVDGEYDDDCSANNVEHAVENDEHVLI
jgi:hypothetical protein